MQELAHEARRGASIDEWQAWLNAGSHLAAAMGLLAVALRAALFAQAVPLTPEQWRVRWRAAIRQHRERVRRVPGGKRRDWKLADWIVQDVHILRRAHTASVGRSYCRNRKDKP
jgi:hypothetical protein